MFTNFIETITDPVVIRFFIMLFVILFVPTLTYELFCAVNRRKLSKRVASATALMTALDKNTNFLASFKAKYAENEKKLAELDAQAKILGQENAKCVFQGKDTTEIKAKMSENYLAYVGLVDEQHKLSRQIAYCEKKAAQLSK